jgi:hypothetical protein
VFGKIYNISVAVIAVTLVLLVIGGALFAVIQGLASYFGGVDLWGPVAEVLLPLLGALVEQVIDLWTLLTEQAEALWQEAPSDPDVPQAPAPAGEAAGD